MQKRDTTLKGRPITTEDFERLLGKVVCERLHPESELVRPGGLFGEGFQVDDSIRAQAIPQRFRKDTYAQLGPVIDGVASEEAIRLRYKRDYIPFDLFGFWYENRRRRCA